jgi:sec-independent protein translocase protein TatA
MGLSGWHVLILALVGILVFGGSGRISSIMGDMAKGIKSFKDGLSEDDNAPKEPTAAAATQLADQRMVQPSERSPTSA